jgi:hypothetical protein
VLGIAAIGGSAAVGCAPATTSVTSVPGSQAGTVQNANTPATSGNNSGLAGIGPADPFNNLAASAGTSGIPGSGSAASNAASSSGPSGPSAGASGPLANTGLPVLSLVVGLAALLAGGFLSWKRTPA